MTHGDFEDGFKIMHGAELIKGARLYMHKEFKTILCPNGELVFLRVEDMQRAYEDLKTWALPVSKKVLNQ